MMATPVGHLRFRKFKAFVRHIHFLIHFRSYHFVVAVWRAKQTECGLCEILGNNRSLPQQSRLELGAASQAWTPTVERSSLLTRIATTINASIVRAGAQPIDGLGRADVPSTLSAGS
jgi:hypothetical protein